MTSATYETGKSNYQYLTVKEQGHYRRLATTFHGRMLLTKRQQNTSKLGFKTMIHYVLHTYHFSRATKLDISYSK